MRPAPIADRLRRPTGSSTSWRRWPPIRQWALTELAARTGLSGSTWLKIVNALAERGYLVRDDAGVGLGEGFSRLRGATDVRFDVVEKPRPLHSSGANRDHAESEYATDESDCEPLPGERRTPPMTAAVAEHLGEDSVIWASDFPHLDASFDVAGEIRGTITGLPESARRRILGENAVRVYGFSV